MFKNPGLSIRVSDTKLVKFEFYPRDAGKATTVLN